MQRQQQLLTNIKKFLHSNPNPNQININNNIYIINNNQNNNNNSNNQNNYQNSSNNINTGQNAFLNNGNNCGFLGNNNFGNNNNNNISNNMNNFNNNINNNINNNFGNNMNNNINNNWNSDFNILNQNKLNNNNFNGMNNNNFINNMHNNFFNSNNVQNNFNMCNSMKNLNNMNLNNEMNNFNNNNFNNGNNFNNNFNNNINNFNNNIINNNQNNNFNNQNQIFNNQIVARNQINNPGLNFNMMNNNINLNNMNNMMMNNNNNMNGMNFINNGFNMNNNMIALNNNMGMNNNMNMNMMFNNNMNNQMNLNQNINMFNNSNKNGNIDNNMNAGTITQIKPRPHKIGLQNFGQTCYMNATLQCLTNVTSLTNKLLNIYFQNKLNIQQHPLTFAYSNLLFEFKTTTQSYIVPTTFKTTLETLNPLFQGNQASDAKDVLFFIIERMHQELKPPENPNEIVQFDFMQQEIEARNEVLTLNKFLNELKNKNSTIISDTFYGITRSVMKCEGCKNVKYSFQTFNILNFILKKVKEDKKQTLGDYYPNNYIINMMDAFMSENKQEKLTGENMIYCNNCKALKDGWIKQDIYQLPRVMIVILNRGKNNADFREYFQIDELLNFQNEGFFCNSNGKNNKYFLCGIITHLGESGSNGHFICYFRNSMNQRFYCYNDKSVVEVSVEDAIKTKIGNRSDDDVIPYILFYQLRRQ